MNSQRPEACERVHIPLGGIPNRSRRESMRSSVRLLVPVRLESCNSYTSGLSTSWSSRSLRPKRTGDLILRRVSRLYAFSVYPGRTLATQRCPKRDNWHTRGSSFSILSY